ncbi:MAG: SAM-dependent methyltransferase [Clostridia bacterium]|nr:SAM-dependent methyltransferase [Clostridia bacterium]
MTDRLEKIFSVLNACEVFADIGCDHGYMAKAMLDSGKCRKVIISDISEKCLDKARELLADYTEQGRVASVVSDGFEKVGKCDLALIAGMGGEEISSILKSAKELPNALVIQPMKNCDKVRLCAVNSGYRIEKDFLFKAGGKYYDLIRLVKGSDKLTELETEFGRDNLDGTNEDFKEFISIKRDKLIEVLSKDLISEQTRLELKKQVEKLEKFL